MAAYEYSALDTQGRQKKGLIEGDTPRNARQILRDRGLTPLEVTQVADSRHGGGSFLRRGGASIHTAELSPLPLQLALLLRSGLQLADARPTGPSHLYSNCVQRTAPRV